jgi:hypothetical protein
VRRLRFPSPPKTIRGFVGALLVFYGAGRFVLDVVQDTNYVMSHAGTILGFIGSPLGNAAILVLGFFLLMWDRYAKPSETESLSQNTPTLDSTTSKEIERLNKEVERRDRKIQALTQGHEQLLGKLTDPTANRQREERIARERCTEVAEELTVFWQSHRRTDAQEFVATFQKRQEWKLDELRERIEKQGLLTTQERDTLTFRSGDGLDKIEQMIFLLRKIGEGG